MRKKDYELIADAINRNKDVRPNLIFAGIVRELITNLSLENPRFDTTKFLESCNK